MCRLFGFKSANAGSIHQSLLYANNSLKKQGLKHPHGWGLAYYVHGAPQIIKRDHSVFDDTVFTKIAKAVTSDTFVAHIRNATIGDIDILNTHPFQYGKWVFAHNGNIKNFDQHKEKIFDLIDLDFKRFIVGTTDSELIFYFLLTEIQKDFTLENELSCSAEKLSISLKRGISKLKGIIGNFHNNPDGLPEENYLTFIISNGSTIVAHHGGKPLLFSTYKSSCDVKDSCQNYIYECENPTVSGHINHLVISSEAMEGNNIWEEMTLGDIIGIDWSMKLYKYSSN